MTCPTCQIAANPQYQAAVDVSCPACCARHILRTITMLGTHGDDEHESRIKAAVILALEAGE